MNLEDLVNLAIFGLGPPFALLLVALALVAIGGVDHGRLAYASVGLGLLIASAAAFVTYWWLWGIAFGYADTNRPIPRNIDRGLNLSMIICATAYGGLLTTGMAAFLRPGIRTTANASS